MSTELYKNRDWLYEQYVIEGKSTHAIGLEIGSTRNTITLWLKKFDIPIRRGGWSPQVKKSMPFRVYQDKDWLYQKYIVEQKSLVEVAKDANASTQAICRHLKKNNIERRPPSVTYQWDNAEEREIKTKEWKERIEQNWKKPQWRENLVAKMKDMRSTEEYRQMQKQIPGKKIYKIDSDWLLQQWEAGKSSAQIAELVGCSLSIACKALRDIGRPASKKKQNGYRTDIELIVEKELIRRGIPYVFEHKIWKYSIDFFLFDYSIALEADGEYWHSLDPEKDMRRDKFMEKRGIRTIRMTDTEIKKGITALFEERVIPFL